MTPEIETRERPRQKIAFWPRDLQIVVLFARSVMASAEYLEELLVPLLQRHAPGFERVLSMRRLTQGANSEIYAVQTAGRGGETR